MVLYQRSETVRDFNGVVVSKAIIKVVQGLTYSDSAPLATLYADAAGLVPLTNPFQADAAGQYSYWIDVGFFSEQVSRPGYFSETNNGYFMGGSVGVPGPQGPSGPAGPQGAKGDQGAPPNYVRLDVLATAGQTIFTTPTYVPGTSGLMVFKNGLLKKITTDYVETSTASITLTSGATLNDPITFLVGTPSLGDSGVQLRFDLASIAPPGDQLVGVTKTYTGAAARTQHSLNNDSVSVHDFGAVGNGSTDDTAAFNAALSWSGSDSIGIKVSCRPGLNYKISGTILLPPRVQLDLCGSTLTGTGSNTCFETATRNVPAHIGTVYTNIGTTADTQLVDCVQVGNGLLNLFGKGFNLYDAVHGTHIHDVKFFDCKYSIYGNRCFTGTYARLSNWDSSVMTGITNEAFFFTGPTNTNRFDCISVAAPYDRAYAMRIVGGGSNGNLWFTNCTWENCHAVGLRIEGAATLSIRGCYFEAIKTIAIDLGSTNIAAFDASDNWFYNVTTAVSGPAVFSGKWAATNYFYPNSPYLTWWASPPVVDFSGSDFATRITVEIPPDVYDQTTAQGTSGVIQSSVATWLLGRGCTVLSKKSVYYVGDGKIVANGMVNDGLVPYQASGMLAVSPSGVPYCTITNSGTTPNLYVDIQTRISSYYTTATYSVTINAGGGPYNVAGIVSGLKVLEIAPASQVTAGATVVATDVGGFLHLQFGKFSGTAPTIKGVVQLLV